MAAKKRNVQDATLKNTRVLKASLRAEVKRLEARIRRLEKHAGI